MSECPLPFMNNNCFCEGVVIYFLSISTSVSSLHAEYMMDEMERRSIVEEPVRKCPVPAPRTSVSSPSASPSVRHKSEESHTITCKTCVNTFPFQENEWINEYYFPYWCNMMWNYRGNWPFPCAALPPVCWVWNCRSVCPAQVCASCVSVNKCQQIL